MNSDENKFYMKNVDLDEIYNTKFKCFSSGTILGLK